jgi:hypothetical protein
MGGNDAIRVTHRSLRTRPACEIGSPPARRWNDPPEECSAALALDPHFERADVAVAEPPCRLASRAGKSFSQGAFIFENVVDEMAQAAGHGAF